MSSVEAMRAYRDPKLPYRFKETAPSPAPTGSEEVEQPLLSEDKQDVEAGASSELPKRIRTLHRIGKQLSAAHRGDYERKKQKNEDDGDDIEEHPNGSDSDSDGDDYDDDDDDDDQKLKKHRHHHQRERSWSRSRSRSRGRDAGGPSSSSENHDRDSSADDMDHDRLTPVDRRG